APRARQRRLRNNCGVAESSPGDSRRRRAGTDRRAQSRDPDGVSHRGSGLMEKDMDHTDRARRVLIIDDRPGIRLVFRDFLDVLGYASDAAVDGQDGMAMLAAAPDVYDLVVTDMKMPGMNGLDVATMVRHLAPSAD